MTDTQRLEAIVTQLDAEHAGACKRAEGMAQLGKQSEAVIELASAKSLAAMAGCIRRTLVQEQHDTQPL